MVGGLLLICLFIYLSTYLFFYLMENIQTHGSFGFLFFSVLVLIIVIFSQTLLSLINIGLFYEFSPQWVREKRGNPFGAVAAKRDLIQVSN